MSSKTHGKTSSEPEVTHISGHGVWLLVEGKEYFMPYDEFPWFKDASIAQVLHVQRQGPGHLYWPEIDVDLTLESIEHPDRFPLKAK